jgi:hypothetical protein
VAYSDDVSARIAGEGLERPGAMLFGRVTYEQLVDAWAGRTDNPFSPVLDARMKTSCPTR